MKEKKEDNNELFIKHKKMSYLRASKLFIVVVIAIFFSCNNKQENISSNTQESAKQDTLAPLKVTVIDSLPDSLQPKTVFLENMPKPLTIAVPSKAGGSYSISNSKGEETKINLEPPLNKSLPVLQNENGETILDAEGKPYTMGDGGKSNFTNFTTDNGLVLDAVTCSLLDKFGNLWFGTHGGGVSRYDGKSFSTFTTAQGLAHNDVWSITEDNTGNLWFGTNGGGVSRYDGKSFSTFTTAQGLAHNFVWSITGDKNGNLWFGTNGGGVSRYDGKSFSTFTTAQGLAYNFVYSITEDNTGNLWFGTTEGLSVMSAGEVRMLAENPILSGPVPSKASVVEGEAKGKKTGIISSRLFKSFTIADGLPDNVVTQIVQMPDGKMAVGTNLGITLFNPSHDFAKLTDIEIYNSNTGYPVKNLNPGQNSMFLDSKGILWAGTGSEITALVRFDPSALKTNMEAPTLVIQSIKVNGENIPWYDLNEKPVALDSITTPAYVTEEVGLFGRELKEIERDSMRQRFGGIRFEGIRPFYPVPENLVLPHEYNQISFEFAAIETNKPFMVKYQYMLEGYDKNWSPVTNRSNANFGNINEGTYTFKFKAQGANGVWCKPIEYSFKVLPPWYRSWWAYLFYTLFFLGTLRIFSKWRERHLRAEKESLEVKVEERTNSLNTTLEHLKATQNQLIQSEKLASLGELTAGIAHEIQNPLNFVNNFSEVSVELMQELKSPLTPDGGILTGKRIDMELFSDITENLEKITLHGKRASSIVKGMLEHSRTSTGEKELTDINALADEYLRLSYHGLRAKDPRDSANKNFNSDFKTDFDSDLPKINNIPQDIGRVLLNLINNAFYAVRNIEKPLVTLSTEKSDNQIIIKVKDNGVGMSKEVLSKIFHPFFTTKPTGQGTGLGLSLAYDIVTKGHGGTIEVTSTEGVGSEFMIILPFKII